MNDKDYIYCLRCGRKLRNPEYRKIGMGKICQEKAKREKATPLFRPISWREYANSKDEPNTK